MSHLNPNTDGNVGHLNPPPPQQPAPPATRPHRRRRARRSASAPPAQAAEGSTGLDSVESNFLDIVFEIRRLVPTFIPTLNNVLTAFLNGSVSIGLAGTMLDFVLQCALLELDYPEEPNIIYAMNTIIEEVPLSFEELAQSLEVINTGLSVEEIEQRMNTNLCIVAKDTSPEEMERCCICLDEYATGDMLGMLDCGHEIHNECIRSWLVLSNSCPLCKSIALAPRSS